MATNNEKKIAYIKMIQDNINKSNIPQDHRYLLSKANDFRFLMSNKIISTNGGVGAAYAGYWMKLVNGENWAFKVSKNPGIPDAFYKEIINERIADAYGMNCIHSKIFKYAEDSQLYAIISKDYRKENYSVVTGRDIVLNYLDYLEQTGYFMNNYGVNSYEDLGDSFNVNSLPIIYQALNFYFSKRAGEPQNNCSPAKTNSIVSNIYEELKKRYVYSYLTMQRDFHLGNWEILENGHSAYLVPMYDLELSFSDEFYDEGKNTSMRASTEGSKTIDEDFETFLDNSPQNRELVERMHYMVNPKDIDLFMEKEERYQPEIPVHIKKQILSSFSAHYLKVDELIKRKKVQKNMV